MNEKVLNRNGITNEPVSNIRYYNWANSGILSQNRLNAEEKAFGCAHIFCWYASEIFNCQNFLNCS